MAGCQDGQEFIGATMRDYYRLKLTATVEVGFLQFYYATGFTPPSVLTNSGFTLPGVPSIGRAVPLLIKDAFNACTAIIGNPVSLSETQPVRLNRNYSGCCGYLPSWVPPWMCSSDAIELRTFTNI